MSEFLVDPVAEAPAETRDDARRLNELGYEQELRRGLGAYDNVAVGFAAISPVVALYGVVLVGMTVAGGAWVWMLPVALVGQCLLLVVYSELASEFPIANGSYQWSRRMIGPRYGWFNGWVCLCAYAVANTTIAYLGAPWALALFGIPATANAIVVAGMVLVLFCALVNMGGVDVLRRAVKVGIAAEIVASVGIGIVLLVGFRSQGAGLLRDTLGAESLSGGSTSAALLAALAIGGWVFIGFDACGLTSEETRGAARNVPRTVWLALLSVAALVILDAFAITLAHPNPADVVAGNDLNPVGTAVTESFGSWRPAVRRRDAGRVPRLRRRGAGHHRPRDLLGRPRRRPAGLVVPPLGRPAPGADRRDDRDRGDRLPGPPARPALGGDRQPDRVRHGRDLRLLPADRRRRPDRPAPRRGGPPGTSSSGGRGTSSTCSP